MTNKSRSITDNEVREAMHAVLERCRTCYNFRHGFAFGNSCAVWLRSPCRVTIGNGNDVSLPRVAHATTDPHLPCPDSNPRELIELAAAKVALRPPCSSYQRST